MKALDLWEKAGPLLHSDTTHLQGSLCLVSSVVNGWVGMVEHAFHVLNVGCTNSHPCMYRPRCMYIHHQCNPSLPVNYVPSLRPFVNRLPLINASRLASTLVALKHHGSNIIAWGAILSVYSSPGHEALECHLEVRN